MKIVIHYTGSKGCSEIIANAISAEVGPANQAKKEMLPPAYMPEGIQLMFLGCEDSGAKMDKVMNAFVTTLNPQRVVYAALFCTSPKLSTATCDTIRKELEGRGIKVLPSPFICNGKGGLFAGGKMPTDEDVAAAKTWAKKQVELAK